VSYEWDAAKAKTNFAKHRVRFADAVTVLEDDLGLTIRDPFSEEEERWITLGRDAENCGARGRGPREELARVFGEGFKRKRRVGKPDKSSKAA
jgi:hypothetical protein